MSFVKCVPCDDDTTFQALSYHDEDGDMSVSAPFEWLPALHCRLTLSVASLQLWVCQNKMSGEMQSAMNRSLVHELIHAYDSCRAHVDFTDCRHHACTEVRSAFRVGFGFSPSLVAADPCCQSEQGLLIWQRADARQHLVHKSAQGAAVVPLYSVLIQAASRFGCCCCCCCCQKCVRRRALESLRDNPHCPAHKAEEAVDDVFERCWPTPSPLAACPTERVRACVWVDAVGCKLDHELAFDTSKFCTAFF
jgi:hypothetical protein